MGYRELTEKDLDVDEKKVFGRIIDMWSLGSPNNPYDQSTEDRIIKYGEQDGLSEERILKIIKSFESKGLIHRTEEKGKIYIKYKVEAGHIVRELQKTYYVHSRAKFKPTHH
ncbi:MAG: hypothetical protein MUO26_06505 [Methanotrichaceae archaeon]|nr:hypothetical protein [Methanotrichaceae archaeon]